MDDVIRYKCRPPPSLLRPLADIWLMFQCNRILHKSPPFLVNVDDGENLEKEFATKVLNLSVSAQDKRKIHVVRFRIKDQLINVVLFQDKRSAHKCIVQII